MCTIYIYSFFNSDLNTSNKFMTAVYMQKNEQERLSIFNEWFEKGKFEKGKFEKDSFIGANHVDINSEQINQ